MSNDPIAENILRQLNHLDTNGNHDTYSPELQPFIKTKQNKHIVEYTPTYIRKFMGKRIVDEYCYFFGKYSWYNINYDVLTFHTIFGAMMGKFVRIYMGGNYEDIRIHTHIFAPTGTGKSRAFAAAQTFAKQLSLNFQNVGQMTTAGLVGTIETDSKGNKTTSYGDIMEHSGIDVVGIEEAGILYDKNTPAYNEDIMKMFQKGMNAVYSGENEIVKKLAGGRVSDFSTCSYLFATYPPPTLSDVITRTGLLQRMFIIHRTHGDEIRHKIEDKMIDNMGLDNPFVDPTNLLMPIVAKLKAVYHWFNNRAKKDRNGRPYFAMKLDNEARVYMKRIRNNIEMKYLYCIGSIKEEISNFRIRYIIQTIKLASHHAMLRLSDTIMAEDVHYASLIVLPEFNQLIYFLESTLDRDDMDYRDELMYKDIVIAYRTYVDNTARSINEKVKRGEKLNPEERWLLEGWVSRPQLVTIVAEKLSRTVNTANRNISKFELTLPQKTTVKELPGLMNRTPSARFIKIMVEQTPYIRPIKRVGKMPTIIPHPKDLDGVIVIDPIEDEENDDEFGVDSYIIPS